MIDEIINKVGSEINLVFEEVDNWFCVTDDLVNYNPPNNAWSIRKVLEHISLTNHYLLILIKKGTAKAIERSKIENYQGLMVNYEFDWNKLNEVGKHQSFYWNRPEHMEPGGKGQLPAIRTRLKSQVNECTKYLNQLPNGEGMLFKTTMTVNSLGKIDVYHYIYFLIQHAKRHLTQMEEIKEAYLISLK